MPAVSKQYDSSPMIVPAMTDNPLNCEALRKRSMQRLTSGEMLDNDLLNYMLGLIQKGAVARTSAGSSQQWLCLNTWFVEKLYP